MYCNFMSFFVLKLRRKNNPEDSVSISYEQNLLVKHVSAVQQRNYPVILVLNGSESSAQLNAVDEFLSGRIDLLSSK